MKANRGDDPDSPCRIESLIGKTGTALALVWFVPVILGELSMDQGEHTD